MKILLKYYLALVAIFVAAKLVFMTYNTAPTGDVGLTDVCAVVWHGLPLDLCTAAYLTAPLLLAWMVGLWVRVKRSALYYRLYAGVVAVVLALIFVADTCLYEYWDIKLDGTVFAYLSQPEGAFNSVSAGYAVGVVVAFAVTAALLWWIQSRILSGGMAQRARSARSRLGRFAQRLLENRAVCTALGLVVGGLLFLAIRGGVGKSTANVGMVYYSENIYLNHCAVNPAFSIVSSVFKTRDYAEMYNFYPEAERQQIFESLHYATAGTPREQLLRSQRPNVLIILMEGCGGVFVNAVDSLADPAVTPHLNRLARQGVVFTRCYANSFRTDRGTVCTLSGYPAFPGVSVMKVPSKCERLPSIARSLRSVGYTTEFLYGGDINFTNTNGYLLATGYERTYGDKDFPADVRRTHDWGVTDSIAFDRLLSMVKAYPADRPWHTTFLTLASHEPWGVPYNRLPDDKIANSMAYLDHCIGRFIEALRRLPQWDNTLVILLPDHGINYPQGIGDENPRKSHIPMIWTGGAVCGPRRLDVLCNQTDLCATLLGQMGLPHDEFRFSRDVLADTYDRPSAVHVWSEGIGWTDTTGHTALNLVTDPPRPMLETPAPSADRIRAAKAFLQTCHDDLGGR